MKVHPNANKSFLSKNVKTQGISCITEMFHNNYFKEIMLVYLFISVM